jgi:hypothetical protein
MTHYNPEPSAGPRITLPPWTMAGIDAPGDSSPWYLCDRIQFDKPTMENRRYLVRESIAGEFEPDPQCWPAPPPLWIRVIRSGGLHYRIPFWRGHQAQGWPDNDTAIAACVCDCIARGGIDRDHYVSWLVNLAFVRKSVRPWRK